MVEALAQRLPDAVVQRASAGLHMLATLPTDVDEHAVAEQARQAGVGLHELHYHCTTVPPRPPAFVLGYALPNRSDSEPPHGYSAPLPRRGLEAVAR